MALSLQDRIQETATANTTVSFTLSGAMQGYQSFAAVGNGNTTYYGATDGTNWEVGVGTYTTSPNTLTRNTILSSSNSGSAVTFSGTVTVFVDYPSEKAIYIDGSGNTYAPNIGGTTPAAGTFTTLNSTGGALNGSIGGTTPSAGTFTTITGQTEVLKGTGENLLFQSNTFTTSWSTGNTSFTSGQTDPFGGSTAWLLTADGTSNPHSFGQTTTPSFINGVTYTYSLYAKKGTNNYVQLRFQSTVGGGYANFDLNAGATGTTGFASGNTPTSSITSVGNGWYRCSMTVAVNATTTAGVYAYIVSSASASGAESNTLSTSVYVYGAQWEIGSVTNTYVPTTTTAVYGTPTLSFSGVAGLGLQSDGSLYVSPAGTGALQAQATTSSTVGGNARGANAVDWQTARSAATNVASGSYSVIGGGINNTVTGTYAFIGGGSSSVASGNRSFIGGGTSNLTYLDAAAIAGGYNNTAAGYFNFIGGGWTNSGTSNSFVTQQAAATNGVTSGSTAVTLAASNSSIKVGQLITGTGIVSYTYVAAISGTSLTLSQNANATGTPTLSFYTPHGVVVGGGNNQATGSFSFIGGGGDAGNAANRNTASGDWSFVGGGIKNTASGIASFVGGGGTDGVNPVGNTASGLLSTVGGGISNQATATGSSILGGGYNTASGSYSTVVGGNLGLTRGIAGQITFPIGNSAYNRGNFQAGILNLIAQTTDATPTVVTSNGSAASTTNQVILPNNSAYYFKARVISGVTGGGNTKAWTLEGAIKRGANAASTAIVGSVTTTVVAADSGASGWTVTATADTTNGGLAITFTGQAGTTIRVVARVETTEVTY